MSKDQKSSNPLAGFMKKQVVVKAAKAKDLKAMRQEKIDEKAKEEAEKLNNAKKESAAAAAEYNKAEMIKKLILENIIRYTALMILLVCTFLAAVKIVPAFVTFIYQTIRSLFSI